MRSNPNLPAEVWQRLQGTLERFENAWRSAWGDGPRPRPDQLPCLDDFLVSGVVERRTLLIELIRTDLDYRFQFMLAPRAEEYLQRYPELCDDPAAALEVIAAEYELCQRYELPRTLAEYLARFPDRAPALEQRLLATPPPARFVTLTFHDVTANGDSKEKKPTCESVEQTPLAEQKAADIWPTVPGYEMLGVLGKGGMGIVYKARHLKLKREVALKVIKESLDQKAKTPEQVAKERRRFEIEAELLARLKHPNIVPIYEVGEYNGNLFYALECCEGGSLAHKLKGKPLPAKEAARLVEKLAGAMQAAHQARIVHRDLKPANVLMTTDGEPKITDFGIAKRLDVPGKAQANAPMDSPSAMGTLPLTSPCSMKTQAGAVMGSITYMSPEQAAGRSEEAGPAADIYALGVILYECLTGELPHDWEKWKKLGNWEKLNARMRQEAELCVVYSEDIVPVRQRQKNSPRDLEAICLKCLSKKPHERYASVAALAEDLQRFREGKPIHARPAGPVERMVKWARRRPAMAWLLGVSLTALAVMLAGWGLFTNRLGEERNTAVRAQQRAEAGEEKVRQSNDRLVTSMARSLLRPLATQQGKIESAEKLLPLSDPECEALWELASSPEENLRDRFIGEALRGPGQTRQLRDRAVYALQAAVVLDDSRRARVEQMLGERLRSQEITPNQRLDVALILAQFEMRDTALAGNVLLTLTDFVVNHDRWTNLGRV